MVAGAFAADVAANARLGGKLVDVDANGNVSALNLADDAVATYKPALAFSVSGEKAGASFNYVNNYNKKDGSTVSAFKLGSHSIWFAPIDGLKFTLGSSDAAVNQESIDWCNTDTHVEGFGYKADFTAGGFSASAILYGGEANNDDGNGIYSKYWFVKDNVNQTTLYANYAADFGKIGFMADFEGNFKKTALALGYSGNAAGTSYFANAVLYMNNGLSSIRGEAFVSTAFDSIGLSVFVPMTYVMKAANAWEVGGLNWHKGGIGYNGNTDGQVILGTTAKLTFPLGGVNGSLYIACNDWLANGLSVQVKPGISGACDIMGWEAYVDMNIASGSFTLAVPFVVTIGF